MGDHNIETINESYASAYFDPLESQPSPEVGTENDQPDNITPEPLYDPALLEDVYLLDSSMLMFVPEYNGQVWERYSSEILPKGMTDETFMRFSYFLFEYFNAADCQYIGSKITKVDYVPPKAVYFKGSSVTCLKYANEEIEGGLKTFGPGSDYDVGLVSQEAIDAMHTLKANCTASVSVEDVPLGNRLAAFLSKVDPGSTNYLDIHNKDKNREHKYDVERRNFFPDGTPHILFCEAMNAFVGTEHPFNFVVVSALSELKYADTLVMSSDNIVSDEANNYLSQCELRVQNLRHSDHTKFDLFRSAFPAGDDHLKPVLVYSWNLLKVYHQKFCEKFPDEALASKTIFQGLCKQNLLQKAYCRELYSANNATLFNANQFSQCHESNIKTIHQSTNKFC